MTPQDKYNMTPEQREIILHALGSSSTKRPLGWRNYYLAPATDKNLLDLVQCGLMKGGASINQGRDRYFFVTPLGVYSVGEDPEVVLKANAVRPRNAELPTVKGVVEGARANAGFKGAGYEADRDKRRLTGQMLKIWEYMKGGAWRTLSQISIATASPEASASASLRRFRVPSWGGHTVERRHVKDGLFEYRLVITKDSETSVQSVQSEQEAAFRDRMNGIPNPGPSTCLPSCPCHLVTEVGE